MKIKFTVFAIFVALLSVVAGTRPAFAVEVWQAKYWNNRNLEGEPVLVRNESGLNNNWGNGSPDPLVNGREFSAEWSTRTYFNEGTYRFSASVDDGMRVYVDGNKIIDVWYDSQLHDVSADTYLAAGNHNILVQYYDIGGQAIAKVSWAQIGGSKGVQGNWTAQYFNNTNLSGSPVRTQQESQINYSWGGSPAKDVNADKFSARWTSVITVDGGLYRFTVRADDGARLWVNGNMIIDQWREQEAATFVVDATLPAGTIPVTVEYYDQGGRGVISFGWSKVSSAVVTQPAQPAAAISDWKGEYYNNINLAGTPVVVRNDPAIDFSWGSSSPVPNTVNHDLFSVRWTRNINLKAGTYTFSLASDDGVRMWVNGVQVIDSWTTAKAQPATATVKVPGGNTTLRVEYFELTGLAEVKLNWAEANATAKVTTPVGSASTAKAGYAVLKNARALNMRSGPGGNFDSVGYIDRSMEVKMIGRDASGSWIKVLRPDGTLGWSASRFLSSPTPFNTLSVVN